MPRGGGGAKTSNSSKEEFLFGFYGDFGARGFGGEFHPLLSEGRAGPPFPREAQSDSRKKKLAERKTQLSFFYRGKARVTSTAIRTRSEGAGNLVRVGRRTAAQLGRHVNLMSKGHAH